MSGLLIAVFTNFLPMSNNTVKPFREIRYFLSVDSSVGRVLIWLAFLYCKTRYDATLLHSWIIYIFVARNKEDQWTMYSATFIERLSLWGIHKWFIHVHLVHLWLAPEGRWQGCQENSFARNEKNWLIAMPQLKTFTWGLISQKVCTISSVIPWTWFLPVLSELIIFGRTHKRTMSRI